VPREVAVRVEAIRPDGTHQPLVGFRWSTRLGAALLAAATADVTSRHAARRPRDVYRPGADGGCVRSADGHRHPCSAASDPPLS
jgi:hypothetical protein